LFADIVLPHLAHDLLLLCLVILSLSMSQRTNSVEAGFYCYAMMMLQLRLAERSTAIRRRTWPAYRRIKSVRAGGGAKLASAGFLDVAPRDVNASINCECARERMLLKEAEERHTR